MSAKWFRCPDGEKIEIESCLARNGCRMGGRCATVPFLRLIGYDREWRGITPSMAGNGPRLIYLKQTHPYTIDPQKRVFAAMGVGLHGKLSLHKFTNNVLSEEELKDEDKKAIPDVLEEDESNEGLYILTDYKTSGSFAVMKMLGIFRVEEPVLGDKGEKTYFKSGEKKGQLKTHLVTKQDDAKKDIRGFALQLNRYRIFFEKQGFSISRMRIMALPRDGGTSAAKSRGIENNIYMIDIPKMSRIEVLDYYCNLEQEVKDAFQSSGGRICNSWERWDGNRCKKCEVKEPCDEIEKSKGG